LNWIDERVAVGNLVDAKNAELLRKEKINLVIDVRPFYRGTWDAVMRILRETGKLIVSATLKNRILLHCLGGMDRSPFLAAIYLHLKHNISLNRAYSIVESKRPQTIVHYDWVKSFNKLREHKEGEKKKFDWNGFWLWIVEQAKPVWVYEREKRATISHLDSWLEWKKEEWTKWFNSI